MTPEEARAEAGNVKKRAFRDLQKLSRSFLGLLLIADDLAEIGDIEEATAKVHAEARAALAVRDASLAAAETAKTIQAQVDAALQEALAQRRSELAIAERALEQARADAASIVSEAETRAKELIAAGTNGAQEALEAARTEAAAVIAKAARTAQEREQGADRLVAERRETLSELDRDIAAEEAKLADVRAAIAAITRSAAQ